MTSQEETPTHELRLGEDTEQLGLHLTKMCVTGDLKVLLLYNRREKPFEVPYYPKDLQKTIDAAVQALIDSHEFDDKRKDIEGKFGPLLSDRLIELKRKLLSEEESTSQDKESSPQDSNPTDIALDLVEEKKVDLFLDEVKTPYALVKVNGHLETIPIRHQNFEDWVGALYYRHNKEQGRNQVLSKEMIGRIQSLLSFEAKENDIKTLYVRVAAFVDKETTNLDENVVFYDLCNKNWDVVRITRSGWNVEPIEQNYKQVLFKRFSINNPQVYPYRNYPQDIMDQFIELTNVHDDQDSKLLAEVYLIALFLLADMPKPMMVPHGMHGSGKSTFQEFIKLVADPAAALTSAFPKNTEDLIQALSHSYLIFFDNVSGMSEITADQLCRAVTGSGFTKRTLYANDDDFIYNMKRAVGYNGINIAATRPDLLDRILNIELKPIDKQRRKKLKSLYKKFEEILPYLLGYIFEVIVKVLNRIGEVNLDGALPRMADFAEMGELIARCLGYEEGKFTEVYNANMGFTNEEALNASPVATAVQHLMDEQATWTGFNADLLSALNEMIDRTPGIKWISKDKEWPNTPIKLSYKLTEVIPNLLNIGIVIERTYDDHKKSNRITIVNNNYQPEANELKQQGISR